MRRLIALVPIVVFSTACVHAQLHVLQQASPDPFAGKTHFFFAPPDFSHAFVNDKPVADWVAEGGASEAKDWEGNHGDASRKFLDRLLAKKSALRLNASGQPGADDVVVQTTVERIRTGVFIFGITESPTEVTALLTLLGPNGTPLDAVELSAEQDADLYHPSFNQRLGDAMEDLADGSFQYLGARTGVP